ncbi:MAG: hypothetical protein FWC06_02545 [Treponema sp.]|nr:hypothetical protein [Treponema sp.]
MTITQTVEVPAEGKRTIEIPREVPAGKVVLTFTPLAESNIIEYSNVSNEEVMAVGEEILNKHLTAFKALAN